jgi:hypothetical protein
MFTSLISLSSGENRRRLSSALETKEKRERETNKKKEAKKIVGLR